MDSALWAAYEALWKLDTGPRRGGKRPPFEGGGQRKLLPRLQLRS